MKFKALLYCRDIKPYVHTSKSGYYCMDRDIKEREINSLTFIWDCRFLNGYIPMECDFEVEEIFYSDETDIFWTKTLREEELCERNCLNQDDLMEYLNLVDSYCGNSGYAIHIKNLHIFDELKKLYNYFHKVDTRCYMPIWEKPKKMMWCKDKDINDDLILIPCTPEEIQRIANKEQTVLVRKTVLKEMVK